MTMSDELAAALERARGYVMSPEEIQAQRESFVRGMTTPCEHGVLDFEQCARCRGWIVPCCDNEQRDRRGGCTNCGDPCI